MLFCFVLFCFVLFCSSYETDILIDKKNKFKFKTQNQNKEEEKVKKKNDKGDKQDGPHILSSARQVKESKVEASWVWPRVEADRLEAFGRILQLWPSVLLSQTMLVPFR